MTVKFDETFRANAEFNSAFALKIPSNFIIIYGSCATFSKSITAEFQISRRRAMSRRGSFGKYMAVI